MAIAARFWRRSYRSQWKRLLSGGGRGSACPIWQAEILKKDLGSQLTSNTLMDLLLKNGSRISKDRKGTWQDKFFIERLWQTIKYEEVYLRPDAKRGLLQWTAANSGGGITKADIHLRIIRNCSNKPNHFSLAGPLQAQAARKCDRSCRTSSGWARNERTHRPPTPSRSTLEDVWLKFPARCKQEGASNSPKKTMSQGTCQIIIEKLDTVRVDPRFASLNADTITTHKGSSSPFSQSDWYNFTSPDGTFCVRI